MKLFTVGFTKMSAEQFFTRLKNSGTERLVDVRLNNVPQLAGFAKKDDLRYFLQAICGIDYLHLALLVPTQQMLDRCKKMRGDWQLYEKQFLELMRERQIDREISREVLRNACLLCSEDTPEHCHRRLVAEYLRDRWSDVEIVHL
jgi:uncharacterized protein (DUF488 family)